MNNAKIALDANANLSEKEPDKTPWLLQRESDCVKIIEAIGAIQQSAEWSTLKSLIFDGVVESLDREIQDEARKEKPDPLKLNRLAGQLKWAEKFTDLDRLKHIYQTELATIRKQLNA